MRPSVRYLGPSEAAGRLGVSVKTLRVYESRGLVRPVRTAAGWRTWGPEAMAIAAEIIDLRSLGFSLAEVETLLGAGADDLEAALASHQSKVELDVSRIAARLDRIKALRRSLTVADARSDPPRTAPARPFVSFALPWPWAGERFEARDVRALNYIVGPLGSGKTRLAMMIARQLPGARFLGLDRSERAPAIQRTLEADPALRSAVGAALASLQDAGATASDALIGLLAPICRDRDGALVIDMIEQGLDAPTQRALMTWLREQAGDRGPLFILTRSSVILDLSAWGAHETVTFCPPNHAPPFAVLPCPGARGHEALETCLATPAVRARTEGMIACMPRTAA